MKHILSILAASAALAASAPAHAYPISPVTLWSLVKKADLVVVAVIEAVETVPPKPDDALRFSSHVAHLKVLETWKGAPREELAVDFNGNLVCPAPPRYAAGEMVLAFLTEIEPVSYRTVALSYGTIYPHFDELMVWEDAVEQALAVQREGPNPAARLRWLVEVAARGPTRWHGIYELRPEVDRIHQYYDAKRRETHVLETEAQRILAEGLVREPSLDVGLVGILELLRGFPSAEVDAVAVAAVEQLLERDPSHHLLTPLIPLTLERLGRPISGPAEASERLRDFLDDPLLAGLGKTPPELEAVWAAARTEERDPPPIQFLYPRPPRVVGTGSSTPP